MIMAEENGGTGVAVAEEVSVSPSSRRVKDLEWMITSIPAVVLSYLQLLLANIHSNLIVRNLQISEFGKLAFTVAITAILGLVFSPNYPLAEFHYFIVFGFMVGCSFIWNGILFETIPLQLLGITLILCSLCVLVGSFLPIAFLWACYLPSALFVFPFIYLLARPHDAAGGGRWI